MSRLHPSIVAIVVVATGLGGVLAGCASKVGPARSLVVEKNEALVERGRYLGVHVAACLDCHSTRDWSRVSGPVVVGSEGKGGERSGPEQGFPGTFYAPNITPHALSSWTDGEIERALVAGLSKDGRPLFPLMPYRSYGQLCQQDVDAVIAWVRTLDPKEGSVPAPTWSFPFGLVLNGIPKEQPRGTCGDPTDVAGYGRYLATAAACASCHTKTERGKPVAGFEWAGGFPFVVNGGTVASSNISPDDDTGIGRWTKEVFVARFREGAREQPLVAPGALQSTMPWSAFAGMTDQDLGAIYDFLRTVPPVKNQVVPWTPTAPNP